MWVFLVILLFVLGVILMGYSFTGKGWQGPAGSWSIVLVTMAILIFDTNTEEPEPTAMDVYQNKTELQYTIKGGEVVDSVVVFK